VSVGLTYSLYENVDDRTKIAVIETRSGGLANCLAELADGWVD
jgi:hypothetical protein